MDLKNKDIFMTGGAGTLGKAIAKRRKEAGWTGKLTVYSTDAGKHNAMRSLYPDVNFIQGDIRNFDALKLAMTGHDVVIHGAAVKFIPDSEIASIDTIDVNVNGSLMVCQAAREAGVMAVLGISTDKACHPANCYGSTKHLMEKIFQEQARYGGPQYLLVRYGNVLESRGSVLEAWTKSVEESNTIRVTNANMTRFWLSPDQAVDYVVDAFNIDIDNGLIYVPKMKALAIGKLAAYWIQKSGFKIEDIPVRPGEKLHETLLTEDEVEFAIEFTKSEKNYYLVLPTTRIRNPKHDHTPYTSQNAEQLTKTELLEMLKG